MKAGDLLKKLYPVEDMKRLLGDHRNTILTMLQGLKRKDAPPAHDTSNFGSSASMGSGPSKKQKIVA